MSCSIDPWFLMVYWLEYGLRYVSSPASGDVALTVIYFIVYAYFFFLNRCQWYFRKCLHWFLFPKVVERHFPLVAFASSSTLNCFSWRGVMMNCFCDPSYREKPNPWLKRIFVVYRLVTCVTVNVYFLRSRVFKPFLGTVPTQVRLFFSSILGSQITSHLESKISSWKLIV